jgi:hypothetical protein
MMMKNILVWGLIFLPLCSWAAVTSTTNKIDFDVNADQTAEMTLNATGLGIGGQASANLQVMGNAIISNKLAVGSSNAPSANLTLTGSMAFSIQSISSDTTLPEQGGSSILLVDTSSANIFLTLPSAANLTGREYTIKTTSLSYSVIINSLEGTIDGNTYIMPSSNTNILPSAKVISNGTNWYVIESNPAYTPLSWSPTFLNATLWLDASDSSTLSDTGGLVDTWRDKSGSGYNHTGSAGQRPVTGTRTLNGHNVVDFDGTDDTMSIAVGPQPGGNNQMIGIVGLLDVDTDGRFLSWRVGVSTRVGILPNFASKVVYNHTSSFDPVYGAASVIASPLIISAYQNSSTVGVSLNGATPTTAAKGGAVPTLDAWNLGSATANFLNGYIAEIVIIDSFNQTQMYQLEGYLAWKWGLQAQLDPSHPYFSAPP